jgi:phosphopantothenoylcysteine decarboxylase/phosphopantothenate--cysteine ligase
VEKGELASGLFGEGRMAEPETIVAFLQQLLNTNTNTAPAAFGPLAGKVALVSAGPTVEAIDPVRFISNRSSGKMGIAIAEALADAGAEVKLVLGPTHISTSHAGVKIIPVESAAEMFTACVAEYPMADVIVMAAAVADYRPAHVEDMKIKKGEGGMVLELEKTHDILRTLGNNKAPEQVLVGFSLETNNERENALKKLRDKNLDMVVLNSLADTGAGFNHDTNKVTLFDNRGKETALPLLSKQAVAREIVNAIISLQHA